MEYDMMQNFSLLKGPSDPVQITVETTKTPNYHNLLTFCASHTVLVMLIIL